MSAIKSLAVPVQNSYEYLEPLVPQDPAERLAFKRSFALSIGVLLPDLLRELREGEAWKALDEVIDNTVGRHRIDTKTRLIATAPCDAAN
jgi:hypothetical protein